MAEAKQDEAPEAKQAPDPVVTDAAPVEAERPTEPSGKKQGKTAPVRESAYPAELHLAQSKAMYGQPRHVVAGALHLMDEGATLTKSNVQAAIKSFLANPVETH